MATDKLQIAFYWGSACGGCDVAVLDTNEFVLELASLADIRLWPIAVDAKYHDVERMADLELDLALYSGAVRNSENEYVAQLLRRKSKVLIALGACAHLGGIPGLANQVSKEEIFHRVYLDNPSIQKGSRTVPRPETRVAAGVLEIPRVYQRVYQLDAVVEVDYYVPGCPPAPEQIVEVVRLLAHGARPACGSIVGASDRAVCDGCKREKQEKKIKRIYRPYEIMQDPARCLLEQGILCAGSVTRGGCGTRCPDSGMPCRGCYGPPPRVVDQGAKFVSAVASIVDSKEPEEVERILDGIPDIMGYAYRFGLPGSLLQRSIR